MTTLATETWTGTDGAAWPAQWTTTGVPAGTGSSATIQSNAGRLTYPTVAGYVDGPIKYLNGMSASRDFDITVTVTFATIQEEYLQVMGRVSADAAEGYGVNLYPHNGTTTCGLVRWDTTNGITGLTGDLAAGTWTAGVPRKVRVQGVGDTIRVKVWDASGSEPGAWLGSATDTLYTSRSGRVAVKNGTGASTSGSFATLDDLTVTDGSAPALTASASLTGSGTLSAAAKPALTSAVALSGSGTLTATGALSGPQLFVNLSGSGDLTATTIQGQIAAGDLTGQGDLTATVQAARLVYLFTPPAQAVQFRIAGRGLIGSFDQGLTLLRVGGQWRTRLSPTATEVGAADRVYAGGYVHELDEVQRSELVDAGFGAYLTNPTPHLFPGADVFPGPTTFPSI